MKKYFSIVNKKLYILLVIIFSVSTSVAYASMTLSSDTLSSNGALNLNPTGQPVSINGNLTVTSPDDTSGDGLTAAIIGKGSTPATVRANLGDLGSFSVLSLYDATGGTDLLSGYAGPTGDNMHLTSSLTYSDTTHYQGLFRLFDNTGGINSLDVAFVAGANAVNFISRGRLAIGSNSTSDTLGVTGTGSFTSTVTASDFITSSGLGLAKKLSGSSTIDFGSIANAACANSTFTLTGATTTDSVATFRPTGLADGMQMTAWVSAINTIKVQLCNLTGGAVDPVSLTYGVIIVR